MIITLIIFLAVLSLLVFVHELGHFWTARRFGVRVDEFGFGIPPRIFGLRLLRRKGLEKIIKSEEIDVKISEDR